MANSDKNIIIVPNTNQSGLPNIQFVGSSSAPISLNVLDDNTVSFSGSQGQLFAINNNLTSGTIFSVNDVSGIPLLEANASGTVSMARFGTSVAIGKSTANAKLDISGSTVITGTLTANINNNNYVASEFINSSNGSSAASSVQTVNDSALAVARLISFGSNNSNTTFGASQANSTAWMTNVGASRMIISTQGATNIEVGTNSNTNSNRSLLISQGPGNVVINPDNSPNIDFIVESQGNTNMLFVDADQNSVGIGTATPPSGFLDVSGYFRAKNISNDASAYQFCNQAGNIIVRVDTQNSRLGINTPGIANATLDVNGNTILSGNLTVTGSTTLTTVSGTTAQFTTITGSKLELNTGTRTSLNYGAYISGVPYNGPLVRLDAAGNTSHVGGTANLNNGGLQVVFSSGYTGTGITFGGDFENSNQSTGNDLKFDTSYANPVGNSGFNGFAAGTTTGLNIGGYSEAANGNLSIGQVGKSITSKASATNIGVVGVARNTGGSSIEIGGYFGLNNSTPVFSSSALTADNGTSTAPIFIARDNGSEVFRISDGGNTIISGNLTVTGSIFVSGSSIYGQVAELTSSTTNYTLVRQDSGKFLHMSSSTSMNLTVPSGLPVGFTVSFCQNGTGSINIVTGSGVFVKNRQDHTKTAGYGAVASLICTGSNGYIFTGDTST